MLVGRRNHDPDETLNVIGDANHTDTVRVMEQTLTRWLVETTDVIEWERDPRFPPGPDGFRP